MSPIPIIVAYSRDPQLLRTRRWVLERAGYQVVAATELSTITQLFPPKSIGLLILCHTLSMEECGRAIALVHTKSPQAQTLFLVAGQVDCQVESASEMLDATRGPDLLLKTVAGLVGTGFSLQSHAA